MENINDARIRDIMAQLEKGPGSTDEKSSVATSAQTPSAKAPLTFEEFLKAEHLSEWPERITSENLLDFSEERELLGTKDDIYKTLKEATPTEMQFLQKLEDRLQGLQDRLNVYADQLIVKPQEGADNNESYDRELRLALSHVGKAFMTDLEESDVMKVHPSRKGKKKMDFKESLMENKRKGLENCVFPGFRAGELTELPGNLETPQILNRVTKAQDFNPGFKKFWKKIFQSEASVAIMQDTFWWIFLQYFEKTKKQSAQDRLFGRIADSFVALFNSINPEVKDKFFTEYSDCLAQAIYAAFHEAFPESDRLFQDEFKQYIANLTSEWVSGIRPPPGSWKKWNVQRLEPKVHKVTEDSKTKATKNMLEVATMNKDVSYSLNIEDFTRMVQRLGEQSQSRVGTAANAGQLAQDATRLLTAGTVATGTSINVAPITVSRQAQCGTPKRQPVESHQVGPGPEMERVLFNTKGQSPLVAHYLQMRQLKGPKQHGRRVRRTEVAKAQPEGPTYKEVINESLTMSETLGKEYQKICEITSQEIAKIEKQQRDINREIERLKDELTFSKNTDIKVISDRILDKREREKENLRMSKDKASTTTSQELPAVKEESQDDDKE